MAESPDPARSSSRLQLRQAVLRYVAAMQDLGFEPNRRVTFEGVDKDAWLIDDPVPHALHRRWLLLEDGDAWCEAVHGAEAVGSGLENTYQWVDHVTEALLYAMDESLKDARAGGDGLLVTVHRKGTVYLVRDRRTRPRT